jgi:hypothetical protein
MLDVPHIIIRFNMAVIKDVQLDKNELTVGRKEGNDIVLDNQAVSGSHCKIRKEKEDYVLVDNDSTNGTFINGRKVTRETLKHKDQIRIARYSLEFLWESKAFEEFAKKDEHAIIVDPEMPKPELIIEKQGEGAGVPYGTVAKVEEPPTQIGATLKGDRPLPAPSGIIKVISGGDGPLEVRLTDLMTYIGTGTQAAVKIKGFMAPELPAAITRRPDGYFLKAVKPGYPKVNGVHINDQIFLESGALIEVGNTNMVFYLDDHKKKIDGK